MPSTSAALDKLLRQRLAPLLREAGFQHVDARNAYSWRTDSIWVLQVRAVGEPFSRVTGWPPGSVCAWLGVFFTFTPRPKGLKIDAQGRIRPAEYLCHMRSHLARGLDQSSQQNTLGNAKERERRDIWWVENDAGNAGPVADDLGAALRLQGMPWFQQSSDPRQALASVESMQDCLVKFTRAALLAKHIGDTERSGKYDALAEAEAKRIGHSLDREDWTGI